MYIEYTQLTAQQTLAMEQTPEARGKRLAEHYSEPLLPHVRKGVPLAVNEAMVEAIRRGLQITTTGVHILTAPNGSGML